MFVPLKSSIGLISTSRGPNAYRNLLKSWKNSARNPIVHLIVIRNSKKIYKRRKIFFFGQEFASGELLKTF